jgi:hypothetical protein
MGLIERCQKVLSFCFSGVPLGTWLTVGLAIMIAESLPSEVHYLWDSSLWAFHYLRAFYQL